MGPSMHKFAAPGKYEQLGIDLALPGAEQAAVVLSYPNSTTVTIKGDLKIVTQLVNFLDGRTIVYTDEPPKEQTEVSGFMHWVEREKSGAINVLHWEGCEPANCPLMAYLEKAPIDEIKQHMPKGGDYEVKKVNNRYTFDLMRKDETKQ